MFLGAGISQWYSAGMRAGLSVGGGAWNFSFLHCVQTGSGAHPASYPTGIGGYFPGGKATGAWTSPRTSI
jgi:hypothetical protein